MSPARPPLAVEVWSDIACPFCYVGKHQLREALARFAHRDAVVVTWRSFQLDPTLRTDLGRRMNDHLAEAKGLSPERVEGMQARIAQMGAPLGIAFAFDDVRVANTRRAHRLLQWAAAAGRQDALKERLMRAYFSEGANVDDAATLAALAGEAGLDAEAALAVASGDDFDDEVRRDQAEARQIGIGGVPFFVFDRTYAVSGAQGEEALLGALERAWAEGPAAD